MNNTKRIEVHASDLIFPESETEARQTLELIEMGIEGIEQREAYAKERGIYDAGRYEWPKRAFARAKRVVLWLLDRYAHNKDVLADVTDVERWKAAEAALEALVDNREQVKKLAHAHDRVVGRDKKIARLKEELDGLKARNARQAKALQEYEVALKKRPLPETPKT